MTGAPEQLYTKVKSCMTIHEIFQRCRSCVLVHYLEISLSLLYLCACDLIGKLMSNAHQLSQKCACCYDEM